MSKRSLRPTASTLSAKRTSAPDPRRRRVAQNKRAATVGRHERSFRVVSVSVAEPDRRAPDEVRASCPAVCSLTAAPGGRSSAKSPRPGLPHARGHGRPRRAPKRREPARSSGLCGGSAARSSPAGGPSSEVAPSLRGEPLRCIFGHDAAHRKRKKHGSRHVVLPDHPAPRFDRPPTEQRTGGPARCASAPRLSRTRWSPIAPLAWGHPPASSHERASPSRTRHARSGDERASRLTLTTRSLWTNCDSPARLPARPRILRGASATLNTTSVSGTEAKRRLRRGRAGQVRRGHAAQGVGQKEMRRLHLLNSMQKLVNSGLLPGALASGESRGFQGLRAFGHPRPHD